MKLTELLISHCGGGSRVSCGWRRGGSNQQVCDDSPLCFISLSWFMCVSLCFQLTPVTHGQERDRLAELVKHTHVHTHTHMYTCQEAWTWTGRIDSCESFLLKTHTRVLHTCWRYRVKNKSQRKVTWFLNLIKLIMKAVMELQMPTNGSYANFLHLVRMLGAARLLIKLKMLHLITIPSPLPIKWACYPRDKGHCGTADSTPWIYGSGPWMWNLHVACFQGADTFLLYSVYVPVISNDMWYEMLGIYYLLSCTAS